MADLEGYRGAKREPLQVDYRDARVLANPPPASGGLLIAFALKVLEPLNTTGWTFGCREHLSSLARAMEVTNKARLYAHLDDSGTPLEAARLLDAAFLERYRLEVQGRPTSTRGTTHISVMDKTGNTAAMTVSNGEGCGHIVPGTGIMLNNMLGEEDLNPQGFHRWQPDQRMTSMMSPSIVVDRGGRRTFALGSGGSNRIRSAILQTLINLIDFDMPVDSAVQSPRLHWENDLLNAEGGFPTGGLRPLLAEYPDHKVWDGFNLFFGGAHVVLREKGAFSGAGDPRRGGVCLVV
jgi:gamma-glutamyltranspeptidase/glutathione hydrolase